MRIQQFRVRSFTGLLAGAVAATALAACGTGSESDTGEFTEVELKYATPIPETAAIETMVTAWTEKVDELTDGAVEIEPYYSGSLVPGAEALAALADGRIDMAYTPNVYFPEQMPMYQVSAIPWLTSDAAAVPLTLMDLYQNNEQFKQEFEKNEVRPLFFVPVSTAALATKERVESIDDLSGTKLRAYGYQAEAIQSVGSEPVFLETAESYEAVQRGTLDGSFQTFDSLVNLDLYEVAPEFTDTGAGQQAAVAITISLSAWDGLNEATQKALTEASDQIVSEALKLLITSEKEICKKLLEGGGVISQLSDSEVDEWKRRMGWEGFFDEWTAAVTKTGVSSEDAQTFLDDYRNKISEVEGDSEYEDGLKSCAESQ